MSDESLKEFFLIKNQTDDVTRVIWLAGWSSEFQRGGSSKNTTRPKSIQAARHSISASAALMSYFFEGVH